MITQTEVEPYARMKPYNEFVGFISTMHGMMELSSTIVLAETGVDMGIFDDAKHLCSWCGLSPANNESAGKKKSVRIVKALQLFETYDGAMCPCCNQEQKTTLLCNQIWTNQKTPGSQESNHCHCKNDDGLYVHTVFEKKPFTPTDYEKLMDPQNHIERVILNKDHVFAYLESPGYDSSKLVKHNEN